MNDTLCAAQRRAIRPAVSPTELSGPFHALATLRGRIAAALAPFTAEVIAKMVAICAMLRRATPG